MRHRIRLLTSVLAVMVVLAGLQANKVNGQSRAGDTLILLPEDKAPPPIVRDNYPDIETYSDGATKVRREINLMSDDSLVNHGRYTEFYKNGQKFTEGMYENGVRRGDWTFWYENGKECKKIAYRDGQPHGEWTIFRENGSRQAQRNYVDGVRDGDWFSYGADGETVLEEQHYEMGLATGKWLQNFESGQPRTEMHFVDGKRTGKFTEWNEEGEVIKEFQFKDGELHGKTIVRLPSGREIVQYYVDGKFDPNAQNSGE